MGHRLTDKPTTTVQGGWPWTEDRFARIELSAAIVEMAEAEYERQYGTTHQTIARIRERGGLSLNEVVTLLADALQRFAPNDLKPKSAEEDR